jgi:eukaryotic-like serine/threonine-protein kinase
LLNEARAAAVIRHPNICPIYDIEEADGQVFIAMAYLEGETLLRRIERGPLPIRQSVAIAMQIARRLEAAHAQGAVHRDIKSANIIVGPYGHVSILDFGLAVRSGATRLTRALGTVGTLAYMSPEQVRGLEVDARTDIWSLGAFLSEMLTGQCPCPFRRDHMAAVSHAILTDAPPSLASLRPETPAELRKSVQTALAKRPERRWQSAREMVAGLERIEAQLAENPSLACPGTRRLRRG